MADTEPNGRRIDINKADELARWAKELGVDELALRTAVHATGPYVENVAMFLLLQAVKQAGRRPAGSARLAR